MSKTPSNSSGQAGWLTDRMVGEYRLKDCIGKGGFASIYRAFHTSSSMEVAFKVLQREFHGNAEMLERFNREIRALQSLKHPHILQILDFSLQSDVGPFLVTELLAGQTLKEVLSQRGSYMEEDFLPLAIQLCLGLDYAHKNDVIHRDIKPENIFLHQTSNGKEVLKLLDFGLVYLAQNSSDLTGVRFIGTPLYMAPEQFDGYNHSVSMDIYSLGVVFFEMITGKPPFIGKTLQDTGMQHLLTPVPDFSLWASPPLEKCLLSMLEKRVEDRTQDLLYIAMKLLQMIPSSADRKPWESLLQNHMKWIEEIAVHRPPQDHSSSDTLQGTSPLSTHSSRVDQTIQIRSPRLFDFRSAPTEEPIPIEKKVVVSISPQVESLPPAGSTPFSFWKNPWFWAFCGLGVFLLILFSLVLR